MSKIKVKLDYSIDLGGGDVLVPGEKYNAYKVNGHYLVFGPNGKVATVDEGHVKKTDDDYLFLTILIFLAGGLAIETYYLLSQVAG